MRVCFAYSKMEIQVIELFIVSDIFVGSLLFQVQ